MRPLIQTTLDRFLGRTPPPPANMLKVWHININSLRTSWGALKDLIRTHTPKTDVIGISETKNPSGRKILPIPGYQAFHNDAKSGTRGTAIYVREEIESQEIKLGEGLRTKRDRFTGIATQGRTYIEAYAPVE